jgi:hypothetical protein
MKQEMNTKLLWVTAAVLGAVATLLTGFGLWPAVLFLLLAVVLVHRSRHVVALSGLLVGFGALWLFLMSRQLTSGGTTGNDPLWIAVGVVPLVLGSAVVALAGAHSIRSRPATDS